MKVSSFGGALAVVLLASTSVLAQAAADATNGSPCDASQAECPAPAASTPAPDDTPTSDDPVHRGFGEPQFDPSAAEGAPPMEPMLTRALDQAPAQPAAEGTITISQATDGRPTAIEGVVSGEDQADEKAAAEAPASVSVTRVTLATGGLAQVEGRMDSTSDTMRLAIERPQVADVLRTLVVTGSAPVVSIDLEAAETVGERSAVGRLLAGDLSDPMTILQSLIGTEVTISGGPRELSGLLLAFTPVTMPGSDTTPETPGVRVAVATPSGQVAYATFPSLEQLAVRGDALSERMSGLGPALAASVDDGRRDLAVRLAEPAEAGFSFVVPTTVWRPSYRALIGEEGDVTLQGWATLENTTGLDWNGIDLRLAVGTPVAYRQDVYSPLRTTRPEAPFEVGRTAQTDIVAAEEAARPSFAMAAMAPGAAARSRTKAGQSFDAAPAPVAELVTGGPAAASSASTVFPVAGSIDLAAGRTLTVPFLSASQDVERITYLDLMSAGRQPFDALQMTFDPDATVPGGLVAVYDADGFVGDARFGGADGGQTRILPFALSADIEASTQEESRRNLISASLRDGSLIVRRDLVSETVLSVTASEDTTLVADVPRLGDDTITATAEDLEPEVSTIDTGRARVRVDVPTGNHALTVVARRPMEERYVLHTLSAPIIEEVLSLGGALDAETREKLEEIRTVTARIAEIDRMVASREAEIDTLRRAVEFDRDNLEAIDPSTPGGAQVRNRIIERSEQINDMMDEVGALRRQREEQLSSLQGQPAATNR